MAYDEGLAFRVESLMSKETDIISQKMFGGIGYLSNGNMTCGIFEDFLIVRVGPELYQQSLKSKHVKEFDITGKAMNGWVMVDSPGISEDEDLLEWVKKGLSFGRSLSD